jgi:hypothetical protein
MTTYALLLLFTQTVAAANAADYVIGIQDVLNVTVFGESDASRAGVTVDNDGTIDCPYIGRVRPRVRHPGARTGDQAASREGTLREPVGFDRHREIPPARP